MTLDPARWKAVLQGEPLPCALVDLDAMERNADRLAAALGDRPITLRIASKSVRHTGLLRRLQARGGARFRGLLCYSAAEAVSLAAEGFDDLLVAYPTVQPRAVRGLVDLVVEGRRAALVVDCAEHVAAAAVAVAGRPGNLVLDVILELDVSYRPLGSAVHLGVRRSPVRSPAQALDLAARIADTPGLRLGGLMAYEAHIAGLPDANPFSPTLNPLRRALKALAEPAVRRLRGEVVDALRDAGHALPLVNGGGTGSLSSTASDPSVTEVTAGSGFLCSHLFSAYRGTDLEPALWFALEATRASDSGYVTCGFGGYVASGEPGWDRLPVPVLPEGLATVSLEGAGEVQTPLRTSSRTPPIALGDPIGFRPAKAGELAERFPEYLLVRGDRIVAREPTYRGQGWSFG